MFKIVHENPEVMSIHKVSMKEDKIQGTFNFGNLTFKTPEEAEDLIVFHKNTGTLTMPDMLSVVKV